jgi:hypothetical protein
MMLLTRARLLKPGPEWALDVRVLLQVAVYAPLELVQLLAQELLPRLRQAGYQEAAAVAARMQSSSCLMVGLVRPPPYQPQPGERRPPAPPPARPALPSQCCLAPGKQAWLCSSG